MTQLPSTKLCKFLRLERKRLSGVGLAQQRLVSLQRCTMLEQLQNKSATEHAAVCARLLAAGGKSAITTLCEFNGLPPCPTREEP